MTSPTSANLPMERLHNVFVGRQPIYDRNKQVVAYELLYRSDQSASEAGVTCGDSATAEVIINTFLELGLESLVGNHTAFINLTRSFITGERPLPFSNKQVVLEVLEDIAVDTAVVKGLTALVLRGYTIALDDFIYRPELEPLIKLAKIIKIDVLNMSSQQIAEQVARLRPFKAKLLAEKVESYEVLSTCHDLGFDYFQGYFFCKPNIVAGRALSANRLVILNLLAKLQNPEIDIKELEALIVQDVALTYRLLRYINSAFFGLRREVESVQRALVYIGIKAIRNWVSLLLMSRIDDKPQELINVALIRARMCEQLARHMQLEGEEQYFTIGLLSVIDAMMDQPMEKLLDAIPLATHIKDALLSGEGKGGLILTSVIHYIEGNWTALEGSPIEPDTLRNTYLEALAWADEGLKALAQSG